jgi:D-alanine-D-alanine ligase
MKKINKRIEIVSSSVLGLSSMSNRSRLAARAALAKYYSHVGITLVDSLADLDSLVATRPDLVFLGMKHVPRDASLGRHDPNKVWLSEYLEQHDIAYTGSDRAAHELEQDKSLSKQLMVEAGVATSPFTVARQGRALSVHEIRPQFPVFIKPIDRGGGAGIDAASLANNFEELQAKVESISTRLKADSLIEEYLPGREFSVAILKEMFTEEYVAMPLEQIAPPDANGNRFLSAQIKTGDVETHKVVTDTRIRNAVNELALKAFQALGARDYGRIDIRLDRYGVPHFLEGNLIPSLIKDYGNFPKACQLELSLGYENMLLRIVDLALQRISRLGVRDFSVEPGSIGSRVAFEAV